MRFSAVVALLSAGIASAALLPRQADLPPCAQTCIGGAVATTTCTDLTDNTCLCQDQPFVQAVTTCITSTCTGADLATAIAGAQAMCADSGVTLTESSTGTGSATTAATGTTTRTTGTGTTAAPTTTTGTSTTATAPATTSAAGNGALTNGVSAAAGIAAVVLGAIAL